MVIAGGALIFKPIKKRLYYLLVKNRNGNYWGFPKGHKESSDKNIAGTVHREVYEEVGLKIELIAGFRQTIEYELPSRELKKVHYFLARPLNKRIRLDKQELAGQRWLPFHEALARLGYPGLKKILKKAHNFLLGPKAV